MAAGQASDDQELIEFLVEVEQTIVEIQQIFDTTTEDVGGICYRRCFSEMLYCLKDFFIHQVVQAVAVAVVDASMSQDSHKFQLARNSWRHF